VSFVGLFTKSRPEIDGLFFDAVIEESDELGTDVTEFPIESGDIGHDHAVQRPLSFTMRVGVSDNPFRAARAAAADSGLPLAGNLAGAGANLGGTAVGAGLGQLGGGGAAAAGVAAGAASAAYGAGQAASRSESVLETIREKQRKNEILEVVGAKTTYDRMMITSTRRETNKENEQALELVVEMQEILAVESPFDSEPVPAPNDPASTQTQPEQDQGLKVAQ
jgi:hypothetical protein